MYLAPLHNPANLIGSCSLRKTDAEHTDGSSVRYRVPSDNAGKKHTCTDFHTNYYEEYKSQDVTASTEQATAFVSKRAAEVDRKSRMKRLKTIVCHLGNGSSVTAVLNGTIRRYIHGTDSIGRTCNGNTLVEISILRSWNFWHSKLDLDVARRYERFLNKDSGVYGLSGGLSSDFRDLTDALTGRR